MGAMGSAIGGKRSVSEKASHGPESKGVTWAFKAILAIFYERKLAERIQKKKSITRDLYFIIEGHLPLA